MQFIAIHKYLRMSPRKVRRVADVARSLSPANAVEVLPHVARAASLPLVKTIESAIANAKQKDVDVTSLTFKEIQVTEGPILKRGRPVSRGQWHPVAKKMSHIRVVLETKEEVKKQTIKKKAKKGESRGTKN